VRGERVQGIAGVAYGLRLRGLDPSGLTPAHGLDWPIVEVCQQGGDMPGGETWLDDDSALLDLDGIRRLALRRSPAVATFRGRLLAPDDLLHPFLGPVGITFGRWLGRETFHAGAFVSGDGAWALIGERESGKSTLLAAMALRGIPVLCDDLVVTTGAQAYSGPRTLDLRQYPDRRLADPRDVKSTRRGTRWRVRLGAIAPIVPLRGWIYLRWSDSLRLASVPSSLNLTWLARWRGRPELPSDPVQMLELGALPAWELHRPRGIPELEDTIALLVSEVTQSVHR
jgi:hypothetical protein